MWKPTNPPNPSNQNPTATPQNPPRMETSSPALSEPTPVAAPRSTTQSPQEQATIGKSLFIKGEVSGSESLYIDGRVEGSINLPGNRVTVGRNGQVTANVTAREIVVLGKLKGNLMASDRVDIRNEGSLTGDVVCQRISIEDGAFFKGGIDIRKSGQNMQEDSSKKPASASSGANSSAKEPAAVTA
jgi:cytoskeletal protein CcmA (bactofilin family)